MKSQHSVFPCQGTKYGLKDYLNITGRFKQQMNVLPYTSFSVKHKLRPSDVVWHCLFHKFFQRVELELPEHVLYGLLSGSDVTADKCIERWKSAIRLESVCYNRNRSLDKRM